MTAWGSNSLYGDGSENDCFVSFFQPVSDVTLADLVPLNLDVFPPKWAGAALAEPQVNKWDGPFSRVSGLYLLRRQEAVVVSASGSASPT